MELGEPAAGQLLIATEPGRGGYFDRSVVLLLEHNEEGSLGICLHKIGEVTMVDSLEHFSDLLTPPAKLFEGGPVSRQTALGLAQVRSPWEEPPGWRRLFGDVGVLDLETPVELVRGTYVHIRIYVGLAGWSAGQLVGELLVQEPRPGGGDFRDPEGPVAPGVAPDRWRSGNLVHLDRAFRVELKTSRTEPAIQRPCGAGSCPSGHTRIGAIPPLRSGERAEPTTFRRCSPHPRERRRGVGPGPVFLPGRITAAAPL